MANKISGRSWLVWFNNGSSGSPEWLPIACSTSNKLNTSLDAIDATSKCGNDMQPGDSFSQTIDIDGFSVTESGSPTLVSESKLYDLMVNKTIFEVKIGKLSPTADVDYRYEGNTWVSKLDEDAADKDKVKFTATLTVSEPPLEKIDE